MVGSFPIPSNIPEYTKHLKPTYIRDELIRQTTFFWDLSTKHWGSQKLKDLLKKPVPHSKLKSTSVLVYNQIILPAEATIRNIFMSVLARQTDIYDAQNKIETWY